MELPLIDPKFGYVEDVFEEHFYKNVDYRDTIIPLWNTLYKSSHNLYTHDKRVDIFSGFFKNCRYRSSIKGLLYPCKNEVFSKILLSLFVAISNQNKLILIIKSIKLSCKFIV